MNKIDQLISRYCPTGVPMVRLGEVFTRLKGTPITAGAMKEIAHKNGDVRIFAGGKTIVDAFEKDIAGANIIRKPAVLVQSRGVIDFVYYEKPFTFKNEMWAYTHDNIVSVKYLYYYCKINVDYFRESAAGMGSMPQISLPVTQDFSIPLPPLPVQEEIVRILDAMSDLVTNLDAEISARQKQYEHAREKLLTFDEEVERKPLGEVCEIRTGSKPNKILKNGEYPYINAGTTPSGFVDDFNRNGDEVTTPSRGQGGIGFVGYQSNPYWLGPLCYHIVSKDRGSLSNKYIFVYLSENNDKILELKCEGGTPALNGQDLKSISIPLPSLSVQQSIVERLDKMESLIQNLQAERGLRQKQYEYYREKLLLFAK